jgi:lipopolysaccharide transport system ATP-binding protein
MTSVIKIQNLGKKYILSHKPKERYTALRDVLAGGVKKIAQRIIHPSTAQPLPIPGSEEFWALKDVSFDIKQGDRVGIIGRNGAGKSTLLKVLSRITEPTFGSVAITGRVASLLEVGTGFHPELTGRENIYLNGAILGMSKAEITKKFDEIVAFAEVERFLDTPVKRYSSGMYVRLAFAVAAHLEPDILIVDEVLAVGDAQFQKKCLGQMEKAGKDGRTVLFVSHNMAMISNLCQKGIVLEGGKLLFEGAVSDAVVKYYQSSTEKGVAAGQFESETAVLLGSELIGAGGALDITIHDDLTIRMRYKIKRSVNGICVPNFHFFAADGSCVFISSPAGLSKMPPGEYFAECKIPGDLINDGAYCVGVALTTYQDSGSYEVEFFDQNALIFNVIDPMDINSNRYGYGGPIPGSIRPQLSWEIGRADL